MISVFVVIFILSAVGCEGTPKTAEDYAIKADKKLEEGKPEEALELINRAIELDEEETHGSRAFIYHQFRQHAYKDLGMEAEYDLVNPIP